MLALAMIINNNRNYCFIVLATVITIVNYDRKTFIVQATDLIISTSHLLYVEKY